MPINRTTIVQKYKVIINGSELKDVVNVTGVGLGEEGSVEAVEPDLKVDVSDGVRKIDPISITIAKRKNLTTFNRMKTWWDNRANTFYDVAIVMMDKLRANELHRYYYGECEIKSWKEKDLDQASPQIGMVDIILLPYGVDLVNP